MSQALVNLYEGSSCIDVRFPEDKVSTVELIGAPLPREGELFHLEEGLFRVNEVMHDGWSADMVDCPEIIVAARRVDGEKNQGV